MDNVKPKVKFRKLAEARPINAGHEVRVTRMNHIVEVLSLAIEPDALTRLRKIDKYRYVDLETGEIFEYQLCENRGQNIAGLKKTFKTIRNIINNNFTGAANELFITLSYAEEMTDVKRLYDDYRKFIQKFKRKYPDIDYMSIVEPQGRGAWHCHVLVRFNDRETVYISNNDVIWPMWGHGFTKTKSLRDVDNIGAYLNAYLSDVEVSPENEHVIFGALGDEANAKLEVVEKEITENGEKTKKKYVKGARLHLYPSGMNLYRCSRGIKKPETVKMTYNEAKKIVGSAKANYSRTIDLDMEGRPLNSITYEQYNLLREKSKPR